MVNTIQEKALSMRKDLLTMLPPGKVGHLGGSSSAIDLIGTLYFYKMCINPNNPKDPQRDYFIMSKGHAVLAQYAALCEAGFFDRSHFDHLKTLGGLLQGHPDMKTPGIEAVTGSLGQGLSIGAGIAYSTKILDQQQNQVFVMCGDGEMAEGQLWEAASFIAAYKLSNLTMILDHNQLQASGRCADVLRIPKLAEKLEAFGWEVIEIDGHAIPEIIQALDAKSTDKPKAIIAHTIKGKGFPFAEGVVSFHNGSMSQEQYNEALIALENQKRSLS